MLSGDNEHKAERVANELGLTEFRAELTPEGKVTLIESMSEADEIVAMVGDGINDAPAPRACQRRCCHEFGYRCLVGSRTYYLNEE